jgi:glycerol-3-phosphate dehydrogenase
MTAADLRRGKLRRLGQESFDLLVVGGGINGAGIAREAALRGLRIALVEKTDFASGTSSRSSKLIHGGFRYLETGDFGLVLEASRERDLLRRRLAPHLVTPLRFFFPIYRGGSLPLWKLRVGLTLYDLLAAFRNIERHRTVHGAEAAAVEPRLRAEGLVGGALYYDCFTDDARLVLENVLGAEQAGAICLNYAGLEALEKDAAGMLTGATVRDHGDEGGTLRVRARTVVNAGGPWLDRIRALDDPAARPVLRPTKGVHLIVPRDRVDNRHAIVLSAVRDRRILFVIPWEDHTIVGTTDTDYEGSPDAVTADDRDVDYLLETLNVHFQQARLKPRDVISTFAGLRPLVAGARPEAPSEVSREDVLFESASGLLSLGGGKLTTYRRVAIKVVDRIARRLRARFGDRVRPCSGTESIPLPGGAGFVAESAPRDARDLARFLRRRYGSRASEVLSMLSAVPELAEPLMPEIGDVRAQAVFAAQSEMAQRVEDVLRRRTTIALKTADGGAGAAAMAAALMAQPLGWNRQGEEVRAREYVEEVEPVPQSRRQA